MEREKKERECKRLEAKVRDLDGECERQHSEIQSLQQSLADSSCALTRAEEKVQAMKTAQRKDNERRQRELERQRARNAELNRFVFEIATK